MRILLRFTLGQVLFVLLLVEFFLLSLAYSLALRSSAEAVLFATEKLQDQASSDLTQRVEFYLGGAESAIEAFTREVELGVFPSTEASTRSVLYALLLAYPNLSELTFTVAKAVGRNEEGDLLLSPGGRYQLQLKRRGTEIEEQRTFQENGRFTIRRAGKAHAAQDPTKHLTFLTPTLEDFMGRFLWSDLHWEDASQKNVVVTVQKAIYDKEKNFLGVLKAGLNFQRLTDISNASVADRAKMLPGNIFILDTKKRMISGFSGGKIAETEDGELRWTGANFPIFIPKILEKLKLESLTMEHPAVKGSMETDGETLSYTFRLIPRSQQWVIGSVLREEEVLYPITRSRNIGRAFSILLFLLSGLLGYFILRTLKKFLNELTEESGRLNQFRFEGLVPAAPFRDLSPLSEGIDRTKMALRTMSKYASVDLVRDLFLAKQEAVLGAESKELTVLFSDIEGFTSITENSSPNDLAVHMGIYFEEMIAVMQARYGGTVDKFIGDALMVFWNAPKGNAQHAHHACASALDSREISKKLTQIGGWKNFPAFYTRMGIHTDSVLVGHFGARERMNYSALGDGVNLASRLESLNKFFGTTILVSDKTKNQAGTDFFFREVDEVAVVGRKQSSKIYELVSYRDQITAPQVELVQSYEAALAYYRRGDFSAAVQLLAKNSSDKPSQKLLGRVEKLMIHCPEGWSPILRLGEK